MTSRSDSGRIVAMQTVLLSIAAAFWDIFKEAAPYVLVGFLVAGIMRAYLRPDLMTRFFRRGRIKSVLNASLLGIPIPI